MEWASKLLVCTGECNIQVSLPILRHMAACCRHRRVWVRGVEEDVVFGGSLVHMYAKCGSLEDGPRMFDKLPSRNIVAGNSMIAGYS